LISPAWLDFAYHLLACLLGWSFGHSVDRLDHSDLDLDFRLAIDVHVDLGRSTMDDTNPLDHVTVTVTVTVVWNT